MPASFPVFQFDPKSFPILTPQQSGPFGGVLADAIANRLKMAQTASSLAYANAVVPQFQAKLLGVPGAISNLQHPQTTLNNLENYPNGAYANTAGAGTATITQPATPGAVQPNTGLAASLGAIGKGIMNWLGGSDETQPAQQTATLPATPAQPAATGGYPRSPESTQWSENQGAGNRTTSKGTALGEKEGAQIAEYGEQAASVAEQQKSLKYLNNVFQDPALQQIADTPFVNQRAISWYKQTGTKEQKAALGRMDAAMNSYIGSSLKMFGSRATDTDVRFLQGMKPSDSDTMDVRKGKWEALKTYIDAKAGQIGLAENLMRNGNYTKAQAETEAASQINMDAIAEQAHAQAFPAPVRVRTPDGHDVMLPPRGAKELLKDHPGYRIIE